MKKLISLVLVAVTLLSVCTVSVSAAAPKYSAENVPLYLFDPEYYAERYPDLAIFNGDKELLYIHFMENGVEEGRSPSATYEPDIYLHSNPDLMERIGENYRKLYAHFVQYGQHEFRPSSIVYTGSTYYAANADLRIQFGNQSWRYLDHFYRVGMSQRRMSSEYFNVRLYAANYDDLRNAFGNHWKKYYIHYAINGYEENRIASTKQYQKPEDTSEEDILAELNSMMNGSSYSGVYKLNKRYTGPLYNYQCKGFAVSVFQQLFDYHIGSTGSSARGLNYQINYNKAYTDCVGSVTNMTEDSVRKLFSSAKAGDFVQIKRKHGGSHSSIVVSVSDTGIVFFECNLDGRNGIVKKMYTWSNLCRTNAAMSLYRAKDYKLHRN